MRLNALQVVVEQLPKNEEHYDTERQESMRDYLYELDLLDNIIFHEQQRIQKDIETYREANL